MNIRLVEAEQRICKWMFRIERIVRVAGEIDIAIGARKGGLILAAALRIEAGLEIVRADDLRDIVYEIERVVLVDEREAIEVGKWKCVVGDPAVSEIGHVTESDIRKELGHVDVVDTCQRVVVARLEIDEVAARTKDELIGQRRTEDVSQRQDTISTGTRERNWREREVETAREAP